MIQRTGRMRKRMKDYLIMAAIIIALGVAIAKIAAAGMLIDWLIALAGGEVLARVLMKLFGPKARRP